MPCRTRMRPPRFRTKDVSTCMGSPTARGSSIRKPFARGGCCLLVSELDRHLGIRPVSQLDTQPVVSPVNASRLPSRAETSCITRGRGGWLGLTPWKTCTSYPLPAFLAHSLLGQTATWRQVRATSAVPPQSRHALTRLARQFRAITGLMHRSKHQAGPFPRSVSCTCRSSALLTNSTESIAAPSWVRNCSPSCGTATAPVRSKITSGKRIWGDSRPSGS